MRGSVRLYSVTHTPLFRSVSPLSTLLQTLAIIGIAIGGVALLMFLIIVAILVSRKNKSPSSARTTNVKHIEMTEDGGAGKPEEPSEPSGPLSVRVAGRG